MRADAARVVYRGSFPQVDAEFIAEVKGGTRVARGGRALLIAGDDRNDGNQDDS